jgi:hypothetical protein
MRKVQTGVLPDVVHVLLDRLEAVVCDDGMDETHTLVVRCDLL